jgi:hypothetical protein
MTAPIPNADAISRPLGHWRPSLPALVLALATVPFVMHATLALTFQNVAGGITITGAGTGAATLPMGTVSKYGSVAAGITRAVGASNYTLSTPMGVRVTKTSEASTSYTLRSKLGSSSVLVWRVAGITLTTSFANVAAAQAYATTYSYTLDIVIPDSQATGTTSREVDFIAVAN